MSIETIKPQLITINDKRELYNCYMPFIKGGGIFIPFNDVLNQNQITPGKKIFVILSLLDAKVKHTINGKVVFIGRTGVKKGFGIAFGETPPMKALKEFIDVNIADMMLKKEPNYTF